MTGGELQLLSRNQKCCISSLAAQARLRTLSRFPNM